MCSTWRTAGRRIRRTIRSWAARSARSSPPSSTTSTTPETTTPSPRRSKSSCSSTPAVFFRLPGARFEAAVERLVRLHADRPEKALAFATYFVYPNVALSSLVDYERIADRLTTEERRYFFRALVDCVVFDQHDDYRPRFFFELDSPLHDDETRRKKDAHKERILAPAGQKLYRIRAHEREHRREALVAML